MIQPQTMLRRADTALSSTDDGKTAIMDIGNGTYFDLEEPGTTIWELLEEPHSFASLCDELEKRFGAPRDVIAEDTTNFLIDLKAQGLLTIG